MRDNAYPLVPLGIGEMLDRAVTLVVRNVVPMLAIVAVVSVPLAVLSYFATPDYGDMFRQLTAVVQHPGANSARKIGQILSGASLAKSGSVFPAVFLLASFVLGPLAQSAVVASLAARYRGVSMTFAQAYRIALRRFGPVLVVGLIFVGITILAFIGLFVAVFAVALAGVLLALAVHNLALRVIVVGIVVVLAALVMLVVSSCGLFVYEYALVDVIVEQPNPMTAVTSAFRRGLSRGSRKRTLGLGLAYVALSVGVAVLSFASSALLAQVTSSRIPDEAVQLGLTMITQLVVSAFAVVAFTDVRVRREGLDLEVASA